MQYNKLLLLQNCRYQKEYLIGWIFQMKNVKMIGNILDPIDIINNYGIDNLDIQLKKFLYKRWSI